MIEITTVLDGVEQVWCTHGLDFLTTLYAHGYEIVSVVI